MLETALLLELCLLKEQSLVGVTYNLSFLILHFTVVYMCMNKDNREMDMEWEKTVERIYT